MTPDLQRWWPGDLGPAGRRSSPAATSAASRRSCSATSSATAATAARTSRTAKPVSVCRSVCECVCGGRGGHTSKERLEGDERGLSSFAVLIFMVIGALRVVVLNERDDETAPPWLFSTSKRKISRQVSGRPSPHSPSCLVFVSFQRRRVRQENQPVRRGRRLQPDQCQRRLPVQVWIQEEPKDGPV